LPTNDADLAQVWADLSLSLPQRDVLHDLDGNGTVEVDDATIVQQHYFSTVNGLGAFAAPAGAVVGDPAPPTPEGASLFPESAHAVRVDSRMVPFADPAGVVVGDPVPPTSEGAVSVPEAANSVRASAGIKAIEAQPTVTASSDAAGPEPRVSPVVSAVEGAPASNPIPHSFFVTAGWRPKLFDAMSWFAFPASALFDGNGLLPVPLLFDGGGPFDGSEEEGSLLPEWTGEL
jgi:hypothetical protein